MFSQSIKVKNLRVSFLAALLLIVALILGACQDTGTGEGDMGPANDSSVIESPQDDDLGGAEPNIEEAEEVPLGTPEGDLIEEAGSGGEAGDMDESGQEDMPGEAGDDASTAGGVEGEATPESE